MLASWNTGSWTLLVENLDIFDYFMMFREGFIENKKDYRRISLGHMIQFGDSEDIACISA